MHPLVVALLIGGLGCFHPAPPAGAPCGAGETCPSPLVCEDDVCVEPVAGCGDCQVVPANDVDPAWTEGTSSIALLSASATFDTDDGSIGGALVRPPGQGILAGIGYYQLASGGVELGVFTFASLQIVGEVRFTGSRAAVFLSDGAIEVSGRIDLSGGCYGIDRSCAGPGGGTGATSGRAASGPCGASNAIMSPNMDDAGGGGGGGGELGASGGTANAVIGGGGGAACIAASLIPLRGGGGGGAGGAGASAFPPGGGGGGAIQLTSQTAIALEAGATLRSTGAGGSGGETMGQNAGAGSGGGGGGGILLEAPMVRVEEGAVVAANGGGGGGGGNSAAGPGGDGMQGGTSAQPASGGIGTATPTPGNGGTGGAGTTPPKRGDDGTNAGGGGGARGVIAVRSLSTPTLSGTLSPSPTTSALVRR